MILLPGFMLKPRCFYHKFSWTKNLGQKDNFLFFYPVSEKCLKLHQVTVQLASPASAFGEYHTTKRKPLISLNLSKLECLSTLIQLITNCKNMNSCSVTLRPNLRLKIEKLVSLNRSVHKKLRVLEKKTLLQKERLYFLNWLYSRTSRKSADKISRNAQSSMNTVPLQYSESKPLILQRHSFVPCISDDNLCVCLGSHSRYWVLKVADRLDRRTFTIFQELL